MLNKLFVLCLLALLSGAATAQPLRLVAAGASITSVIQRLDLDSLLVGLDSTSAPLMAGRDLPNVGYQRQLSAEGILSLRPDVLLGSEEMGPPAVLTQLREAGVEVIVLSAQANLPTLYENIGAVGQRFSRGAQAEHLVSELKAQVAALPQAPAERPHALFLLSHSAGSLLVGGAGTAGDSLIELGGMHNPVAGQFSQYRSLSAEALLQLRPEWLITTSQSIDQAGGSAALLALQPALAKTPAGQKGQLVSVDGALLVGGFNPAIVDTLAQLRQAAALSANMAQRAN